MSKVDFTGRVAVITGAGAGLGREYALLLASRGAKVVVNDLGGDRSGSGQSRQADVVVNEIKANGGIAVANYDSVVEGEKIIKTALENFGRIDIVINNAGILRDRSFPRISEQDWDLIQNVHLKGSFKTTQAAWETMKKQKYGRIIMTSSTSGTHGNFGQANYSAAKAALIGLSNTIAIEGSKYNIHCNVIIPTAASRLTEDIFPEHLFQQLKPKLIAPVVAYLCHESNSDNGAVIESAGGWAAKVQLVRGTGSVMRASLNEDVTIEGVRDAWDRVIDMSNKIHISNNVEATGSLLQVLENQKDGHSSTATKYTFGAKDISLYALGIGASVQDENELKFIYENHSDFTPYPTFFVLPAIQNIFETGITAKALAHGNTDLTNVLHGEHYVEIFSDLPTDGVLSTKSYVVDVLDKRSGAVIITNSDTYDESGTLIAKNQSATFVIGAGNFNGKSEPSSDVYPTIPCPKRNPDATIEMKTSIDQAAIYRLSGDINPLHIDPNFSKLAGHQKPILHGLCSLGLSMRAVLKIYANNDATQFKAIKVRFIKPVLPGQTLKVSMWQNGNRIHFTTNIAETGVEIISGAYIDLKMVLRNLTSTKQLESDAVFQRIAERVSSAPEVAKSINGVFAYRITVDGKIVNEWTVDLKNALVYNTAPKDIKADTTLTISDKDMVDIATGKLNAQQAFMKGKLKIGGNIMLTQKLIPLLKVEHKL